MTSINGYIGQTKNYLQNRINNHKNDIRNCKATTALATHALDNLHQFNFNETKILVHEQNYKKRLFLEMAHIVKNDTINNRTDINNLADIYNNLIKS